MSIMLSKTFAALRDAGATEEMAREAAEEIADFNNRLSNIEAEVKGLQETRWLVRVIVGFLFVWALKDFP